MLSSGAVAHGGQGAHNCVFEEVPLTAIRPEGWLRQWLENQREGITGHVHEYNTRPFSEGYWLTERMWNSPAGGPVTGAGADQRWWGYEQSGYWLDGAIRCGYLLDDPKMVRLARERIDYVLAHPGADGSLGPPWLDFMWPFTAFFRAWMAEFSATSDAEPARAMAGHYLANAEKCMMGDPKGRSFAVLNTVSIEILCWLYEKTGDRRLLRIAEKAYRSILPSKASSHQSLLSRKVPREHGVVFIETLKSPALLYKYTGRKDYLEAAINGVKKLERHHGLINGVPSSMEDLSGREFYVSNETCNVSAYTWTLGYLLQITGDVKWADMIERACFNAGIGAVTKDFKAHQYFTSPNQVIATRSSWLHVRNGRYEDRDSWWVQSGRNAYSCSHNVQCCTGNVSRFMPNYIGRMWLSDGKGGIAAADYGPSRVTAKLGPRGKPVTIVQQTDYPFCEEISFHIKSSGAVRFPFMLRIPGWCEGARITYNGKEVQVPALAGEFVTVERSFRPNDRLTLTVPMEVRLSHWPRNGLGVERGPLVYALRIKAKKRRVTGKSMLKTWRVGASKSSEFPSWEMTPQSRWSYALALDEPKLQEQVKVVAGATRADPWDDAARPPVSLEVPARRVRNWNFSNVTVAGRKVRAGPVGLPEQTDMDEKLERITLVPYGATCLRLSVFPDAKRAESK